MEKTKNTNSALERLLATSGLDLLDEPKKTFKIIWTKDEIIHRIKYHPAKLLREIVQYEYMSLIYDSDHENNEKLRIIRTFYKSKQNENLH